MRRKLKKFVYKDNQVERCRLLYKLSIPSGGHHFFIMDGETYCYADPAQVPGVEFYNELPEAPFPLEQEVAPKEKFAAKFSAWQAIADDGVSEHIFHTGTINAAVYLKECVSKGRRKKGNRSLLFWPDLATAHYALFLQTRN
ncbi:hypothetical protein ILUMI_09406 [Ignelater luminosus]|uniref:Uncharacterized protein n=1 Tax=Ignelater luminosus TaxID=2038154 RepID=A0A8K0D538_IGNLU|nr:hypothetical protein ILUMI_09406 [Ignelater luminosus]